MTELLEKPFDVGSWQSVEGVKAERRVFNQDRAIHHMHRHDTLLSSNIYGIVSLEFEYFQWTMNELKRNVVCSLQETLDFLNFVQISRHELNGGGRSTQEGSGELHSSTWTNETCHGRNLSSIILRLAAMADFGFHQKLKTI
jgi:hypothetical protein